jgi:hypothetical protein
MDPNGDALSDIRGESLLVDEPAPASEGTTFLDAVVDILSAPFEAAADVITGAQNTAASVANSGASVITGAQDTAASVADSLSDAASPANLFGLGSGVAIGGLLTASALALVAAFATDQLLFGGTGTLTLARAVARRTR